MRVVKVNHVVLTLKISPHGAGLERDQVDEMINKRLAEGYDEVQVELVRTNQSERLEPTDVVMLYIFKAYEKEVATRVKKSDA